MSASHSPQDEDCFRLKPHGEEGPEQGEGTVSNYIGSVLTAWVMESYILVKFYAPNETCCATIGGAVSI